MKTIALTSIALFGLIAAAPCFADKPATAEAHPGRFQMTVALDGGLFVCDTSTGQCWRLQNDGSWLDFGSPIHPLPQADKPKIKEPSRLSLPSDPFSLNVRQRSKTEIPGADEPVYLNVDDVTNGQAAVSIKTAAGTTLVFDRSVEPGDSLKFKIGETACFLYVEELKNFLIGEDRAVFQLTTDKKTLKKFIAAGEKKATAIEEKEDDDRP